MSDTPIDMDAVHALEEKIFEVCKESHEETHSMEIIFEALKGSLIFNMGTMLCPDCRKRFARHLKRFIPEMLSAANSLAAEYAAEEKRQLTNLPLGNTATMRVVDLACRLGYPVFPCAEDKTPTCKHGYLDAVEDETQIRQLWRIWPGPLIGVPTGSRTGFDVVDIDLVKHPEAGRWLEDHRQQIPATRQHRTRSGGLHLLFKHPKDLRCSQGKLCIGVDIRADGGYIVWWPAHVPQAQEELDRPLAEFPDWLFKQLTARPPRLVPTHYAPSIGIGTAASRLAGILRTAAEAEGSSCAAVLFWCANRLRDMAALGEINREQFVDACQQLEQTAAAAGLPPREIDRTIANAMRSRS